MSNAAGRHFPRTGARAWMFLRSSLPGPGAFLLALFAIHAPVKAQQSGADTNLPGAAADVETNLSDAANIGQQSVGRYLPEPLGSWNGWRPYFVDRGLTFAFTYQADPMSNLTGGLEHGNAFTGRAQATMEYDPEKTLGWKGGLLHVSAYQIHGKSITTHFTGSISFVSELEAYATTRLYEAWYEQKLFDDKLSLRFGQLGADTEFFLSPFFGFAIGGTFGWPVIASANLPSAGPAYPFGALAVRAKYTPTDKLTFLLGVFNGDPAGPAHPGADDNPQRRNRYGVNFRLRDAPLLIGEAQIKFGDADKGPILPGTLRLGAWNHFGRFADKRFASDGRVISDPASLGTPMQKRGDYGLYAVIDQQIYQRPDKKTDGIYVFGRAAHSPADRSMVDFYFDGGVSFIGMIPSRRDDQFGFVGTFSHISQSVQQSQYDQRFFNASFTPIQNFEAIVEATYIFNVANGFNVQPSVQYVFHPGANSTYPYDTQGLHRLRNALVLGLRTTIQY